MREIIISEIQRIAKAGDGTPPGQKLFRRETGIGETKWRGVYWARWSDALVEAGFKPNQWQAKLDTAGLIGRMADLTRHCDGLPTYSEMKLLRRSDASVPSPRTLLMHFSSRAGLVEALRTFCAERDGFEDVLTLLPTLAASSTIGDNCTAEGWVYLLKSGPHYKIGRSDQLERRVKSISITLPEETLLVHAIRTDDPPGIEAYWHRRFANRRAKGEWFKLTARDVSAFTRRTFQ